MYSISSPAGLLSTVPVHLGRYPHNSVVAMTVRNGRVEATLRIDRPAVMDQAWIDTFLSYLAKAPCDTVALAVYTDGDDAGTGPVLEAQMNLLAAQVTAELPVTILMTALITPGYWLDYADGTRRPALELEASPVLMEMVANGDGDRNVHTIPGVVHDPEFTAAVEARTGKMGEFEMERMFALWNSLLASGTTPDRNESIRLVAGFGGGPARDGLMCRTFQDTVTEQDWARLLLGELSVPFDRARFDTAVTLVKHLLTQDAPAQHRASLLAGLGWLHWHAGRGTHAVECFDAGLALDAGHRLCTLLRQFVNAGRMSVIAGTKSNWIH